MEVRQMVDWFGGAEFILQAKACPTALESNDLPCVASSGTEYRALTYYCEADWLW
jgi:hypothetical protein